MLAQNFKTAADLEISDVEQDALIKVLGMLERNDFARGESFNMGWWYRHSNTCGTVGCIAGWAYHLSDGEAFPFVGCVGSPPDHLRSLFIPVDGPNVEIANVAMQKITSSQAAIALRSYLTTGDANWEEALQA